MKKINRFSLLIILIFFIFTISGVLLTQSYYKLKEESINRKKVKITNIINSLEYSFNLFIENVAKNTKFLSVVNTFKANEKSSHFIIKYFYALQAKIVSQDCYVLKLDTLGNVTYSFPQKRFLGLNLKDVSSIKRTLEKEEISVSNLHEDIFSEYVISVSAPILHRGKLKGAIVYNIPAKFFNSLFNNAFDSDEDIKVYLLDNSNNIVYSTVNKYFDENFFEIPENYFNYQKVYKAIENSPKVLKEISFNDLDGKKQFLGFLKRVAPKGTHLQWTIFVTVPKTYLFMFLKRFSGQIFLIGGLATFGLSLSFLLYVFLIRKNTKILEGKEKKYRKMSFITGQIMFEKDIVTQKVFWFSNIETMLGYSDEEFNNFTVERIRQLIHPDDRERVIENEKLMLTSKLNHSRIEYRLKNKFGNYIYIEEIETILYDEVGKPSKILGTLRDITTLKEYEAKILDYQKNLERLVEQRTEALEKTLAQLNAEIDIRKKKEIELEQSIKKVEAANRLKSEFLAQISHEVRTPINVIVSHISLFKMEIGDEIPEDLEYSIQAISKASNRLIRTVELIINASEIHTGSYEPSFNTWDIYDQILRKLLSEFAPQAKAKGLELIINEPRIDAKAYIDEYSVRQTFINILDNALKYTNKGKIEVNIFKNRNNELVVEISDTGIGMDEKYIPYLYEIFSQEHRGYTRKYDGNGLGLTLVKAYCDINNIEIKLKTKKNEGTTFTLVFHKFSSEV